MSGLSWDIRESTVDATAINLNATTVTIDLYIIGNGVSWSNYSCPGYITINGNRRSFSSTFTKSTSRQYLGSHSVSVTHNVDGTKAISVDAYFSTGTSAFGNLYKSTSVGLTTIPRASTHVFHPGGNTLVGSPVPFDIKSYVSSFTHKVAWRFDGEGSWRDLPDTFTGNAQFQITVPLEELTNCVNSSSAKIWILLSTYNGTTRIGQQTDYWNLGLPASVKPEITIATVTPVNTNNDFGLYLQNESKIDININGTGIYGSTITEYKVTAESNIVLEEPAGLIAAFTTAGIKTFKFSVKDSRDRWSNETEVKIEVLAYFKPLVNQLIAYRSNASGAENEQGVYIYVKASIGFAECEGQNAVAIKAMYKRKSDEAYGEEVEIQANGSVIGPISMTNTYDLKVYAKDLCGYRTIDTHEIIPTESVAFNFSETLSGGAVGKYAEYDETFENGYKRFLTQELQVGDIDMTITEDEFNELSELLDLGGMP